MKNKKNFPLILLFLSLLFASNAQNLPSFYPYKGFHVGITGQAEYINKCTFVALTGIDPAPKPRWTTGWEVGMEFSYHFAKYFGVSVGINYGTEFSYKSNSYRNELLLNWGLTDVNQYSSYKTRMDNYEMLFPIKLEFHYPLRKDLFFTAEAGVKIKGVFNRLTYGKDGIGCYNTGSYLPETPEDYNPATDSYWPKPYYDDWGIQDLSKISCNLLLGIGLSYKLPYGDLVKFTAGVNLSFNNIIEGYYRYYLTDSYGTFSVKNDFIYTQLSYIHTLNWQKAKKYLKKQEYSFSSKKERRGKVLELLEGW